MCPSWPRWKWTEKEPNAAAHAPQRSTPLAFTTAGGWKVLAQVRWQVTAYNMSLPWMKTKTGNCVLNTSQPSFCVKIFFSLIFFFFVQKYRNWENQTDQENNQQKRKPTQYSHRTTEVKWKFLGFLAEWTSSHQWPLPAWLKGKCVRLWLTPAKMP